MIGQVFIQDRRLVACGVSGLDSSLRRVAQLLSFPADEASPGARLQQGHLRIWAENVVVPKLPDLISFPASSMGLIVDARSSYCRCLVFLMQLMMCFSLSAIVVSHSATFLFSLLAPAVPVFSGKLFIRVFVLAAIRTFACHIVCHVFKRCSCPTP